MRTNTRWLAAGAAATIILTASAIAVSAPPRDGLCADLTGDALTRCLYSDLDDRLRKLEPTPTPTPSPAATVVTISDVTASSVKVNWTSTGADGYKVGRDGRDTTCPTDCPWSTTDPADARSRVFDKLLPGTEYTFFVEPDDGQRVEAKATTAGGPTPTPTPSPPPTPTPTPTPPVSGSWLSGGAGPENANGSFGTWRGSPSEIAATWVNTPDMWTLQPGFELGAWNRPVDVAANVPDWQGWDAEMNGAHDAFWTQFGKNLKKYRGGKGTTYLRIYHEGVGGDWYPWSVKPTDAAKFKATWQRTAGIIRREFPEVKMMLGVASAGGAGRVNAADAWPAGVDVLSIDWYNEWSFCVTKACFDDKIENGAGANSLEDLRRLAGTRGVPVIISEWGNAGRVRPASSGGGGEAPVVIEAFHGWLKANAGTGPGKVLAECYFNIGGYDARFEIYPGGVQPQTSAKYRELFKVN